MDRDEYDLFIVGGGINGCGIARDAAGRGFRVGLAEQGDLAQGTSSASTKLIHGGLRYLEHFEFRLVREALQEREILLGIAPHLIQPLRFVLPHLPGMRPKWMLRLGLFIYDLLGGKQSLPKSKSIGLTADIAGIPLRNGLRSAFEYSDCWVDDARLVILNARDAANHGAEIFTRTKMSRAVRDGNNWRIELDSRKGVRHVTASALVNATGPWLDIAGQTIGGGITANRIRLVQGAHIITRKLFDHERAYIFQNSDRRIVFAIPYENDFTLIGTTDTDFKGDPGEAQLQDVEATYLLEAIRAYFKQDITTNDVVSGFAGVRALAGTSEGEAQSASRDYDLDVETGDDGLSPVLNILGGKITSYRTLAEEALEKLEPFLLKGQRGKLPKRRAWTKSAPLPGGDLSVSALQDLQSRLTNSYAWLSPALARRWVRSYGSLASRIASLGKANGPGRHFGAELYEIEIAWLINREWAQTSEDILWRRSKLGLHTGTDLAQALDDYIDARSEV